MVDISCCQMLAFTCLEADDKNRFADSERCLPDQTIARARLSDNAVP